MSQHYDHAAPVRCMMCGDSGLVTVPHPRCVSTRLGRLVTWPGAKSIRTCAVACSNRVQDAGGYPTTCPPGAAAATGGMLNWDRYTGLIGGLDGVAMLADLEDERVTEARAGRPPGTGLAEMYPELVERAGLSRRQNV
jgi:hypothetical protein